MSEQEIFGKSHINKQDNRVTDYYDIFDEDGYLAQFLNVEDVNQGNPEGSYEMVVQLLVPGIQEQKKISQEQPSVIVKAQKKRSSFHNFQKHLVTTIRSIVDTSRLGHDPETAQCQKKIWKVFMNSKKINKTLVSLVVGDLTEEQTFQIYQYGFKDVMKQFRPQQIKQAQHNIYQSLLEQLNSTNLENQLTKRRMKHKKQFIIYFQAFLEELVKGELDKRMAKCTKLLKNSHL